ncbi:hypothetical protein HNQ39_005121 [Armatimonas rosea]|uniref:Uncharacterized protein n=1 Tax=Armatimonas rosea TaxID=685828 RepID=A0A7W9SUY0_ARMRO|nr:hypothetical protein [Armatimonas rosea]
MERYQVTEPVPVRVRNRKQSCLWDHHGQGAIHPREEMVKAMQKVRVNAGRLKGGAEQLATRPRQPPGYSFPCRAS